MTMKFNDLKNAFPKKEIGQDVVELLSSPIKSSIRGMTTKDIKEVLKAIEKQDEYLIQQAFDAILDRCVVDLDGGPFDVNSLLSQDRYYLLLKIRQKTTGDVCKINHPCPVSKKMVEGITIDLGSCLQVKKFEGESLFKEYLLKDNIKMTLGPITRGEEKIIEKYLKKIKDGNSIIERRYATYAALVKDIYIKTDKEFEKVEMIFDDKIKFIIECCSNVELKLIDEFIKELDFGATIKFNFKSDDYENENEEVNLISFFIM